jgi:hypothetical protein
VAAHEGGAPVYSAGPLIAWLAVMTAGLVGLVLLSSAWTSGGFPGTSALSGSGALHLWGVGLALTLPVVLVLAAGLLAPRFLPNGRTSGAGWIRAPAAAAAPDSGP